MREFPASPTLASAIFLHRQAAEPSRQNAQLSLSLGEAISAEQLKSAWNTVIAADSSLRRAVLPATGTDVTLRELDSGEAIWTHHDWAAKDLAEIPLLWNGVQTGDLQTPFALENPPFFRGTTINLPGGPTHLLLTFPSFLLDDEGIFLLTAKFLQTLEGHAPAPSASEEGSDAAKDTLTWWKKVLAKATPTQIDLRPRSGQSGWGVKNLLQRREESRELREAAELLDITAHELLLGTAAAVFGRLGSTAEGMILANAPGTANYLPARFTLKADQSVEDFLKALSRTEDERMELPPVSLPQALGAAGLTTEAKNLTVALSWVPPLMSDRIHDAWPRWMNVDAKVSRPPVAPITLKVHDAVRILIELHYDQSVLAEDDAVKMFQRLQQVLDVFTKDSAQKLKDLPVLVEGEEATFASSTGHPPVAGKRVEERFLEVAGRHQNEIAVGEGETALTYGEVRDHARSLAGYLRQENIAEGWMIAICLTPSPWVPVATLGVLLAGDTCVPLSPDASGTWLKEKAAGCDAELVICDSQTAPLFAESTRRLLIIDQQWDTVSAAPASKTLAPAPKTAFHLLGTEQDPAPEFNTISPTLLAAATKESLTRWRLKAGSKLPLSGSAGTLVYLETLVSALNSGATLTLPASSEAASLVATQPTHLRLTEAQWRSLILDLQRSTVVWPESIRTVCVEAHTVSAALYSRWQSLIGEETATHFFWSPVSFSGLGLRSFSKGHEPQGEPPIGLPTQGVTVKFLDSCDAELPPHFTGVARIQLADIPGRTWDIRTWRDNDGALHFAPESEVLELLRRQPEVIDAQLGEVTVTGRPQRGAWVALATDAGSAETVTQALNSRLPSGSLDFIFTVERFPLTAGGQIAVDKLPKPTPPPAPKIEPPKPAAPVPAAAAKPTAPATPAAPAPAATHAPFVPRETSSAVWEPITLMNKEPGTPTLVLVHDLEGDPEQLRPLANALNGDWTIYATRGKLPSSGSLTIEDEAATIVKAIHDIDPEGPYHLFGAGYGAVLAYEVARRLRIAGRPVHYLALAGAPAPTLPGSKDWMRSLGKLFGGSKQPVVALSPAAQARTQARDAFRAQPLDGPAGIILGPDQGREVENGWLACAPEAFIERINIPAPQMLGDTGSKRLAVILREWAVPSQGDEE